jgi:hypothetical protein
MVDPIRIVVSPASGRRPDVFSGSWLGRVLCRSRTPFLDAARVLLAEGVPPETPLEMQWQDTGTVSLRSTVGSAAGLMINHGRFVKYRQSPYASPAVSPST